MVVDDQWQGSWDYKLGLQLMVASLHASHDARRTLWAIVTSSAGPLAPPQGGTPTHFCSSGQEEGQELSYFWMFRMTLQNHLNFASCRGLVKKLTTIISMWQYLIFTYLDLMWLVMKKYQISMWRVHLLPDTCPFFKEYGVPVVLAKDRLVYPISLVVKEVSCPDHLGQYIAHPDQFWLYGTLCINHLTRGQTINIFFVHMSTPPVWPFMLPCMAKMASMYHFNIEMQSTSREREGASSFHWDTLPSFSISSNCWG